MWQVGQRVTAELEPELGLGGVIAVVPPRWIDVTFPAVGVTRRYSQQGAPLRRLILTPGQKVQGKNKTAHVVAKAHEVKGLYRYETEDGATLWEHELEGIIADETPLTRFYSGHWAHPNSFRLREQAWKIRAKSLEPELRGLVGPRISLLPHQLSIASDIARREFPRVLLADEVGLGKTIEAGMIYSSLRALGRANRVLIVTPEALENQWLAEMHRRFNEMFSLIDEERSEEELLSQGKNAFQMNQRIICSLSFLEANPLRLEEATGEEWDLLIVDEAHRLTWHKDEPSVECEMIPMLSEQSRGLILLTATPQHQGIETQFGLLHLVDPKRFSDVDMFKEQTKHMGEVAHLAERIGRGDREAKFLEELKQSFVEDQDLGTSIAAYEKGGEANELLSQLVDRHGTGRVLIRNRRSRIQGFPERGMMPIEIKAPEAWTKWLASIDPKKLSDSEIFDLAAGIYEGISKKNRDDWFSVRAAALLQLLDGLKDEKVLLICSSPERVEDLRDWLKEQSSIRTALFHEDLEIVERDRQAAWFAQEDGARLLLCSEIGGEGRNFQFCSHLVLFDLPLHPDTIEQRIGRLDRIGQRNKIQIHVPYHPGTPEEVLFRWYAEGLKIFSDPWNGAPLPQEMGRRLMTALRSYLPKAADHGDHEKKLEEFLEYTRQTAEQIRISQKASVDLLIDLNSFNEERGRGLSGKIAAIDASPDLRQFLERAFDHFGVESEAVDERGTLRLTAHSLTFVERLPGLSSVGEVTATFDRDEALVREDLAFLTWEHPIVDGTLEIILHGEIGKITAGMTGELDAAEPVMLELVYVLRSLAPAALELEHDLPVQTFKVFVGSSGKILRPPVGLERVALKPILPHVALELLKPLRDRLPGAFDRANKATEDLAKPILEKAVAGWSERQDREISRLSELARVNPLISREERAAQEAKKEQGIAAIREASPRLDAIRLLVFSEL